MNTTTIDLVMVGKRAPLTPDGEESAIRKTPVEGPVGVTRLGPDGDEHAYHGHGGPDKAILHCAAEHYETYRYRYPDFIADIHSERRGFGENITTLGMTEETVCLGDRYRIGPAGGADTSEDATGGSGDNPGGANGISGDAPAVASRGASRDRRRGILVEVTGFRQPCWKLGYNAGVREIPRVMQDEGTPGWYYRVLEEGDIAAGDVITLVERPYPEWTIARLTRGFYLTPMDRGLIESALAIPVLGGELRQYMNRRLETGELES
jgi:MOSC domain-containing protein YiiM